MKFHGATVTISRLQLRAGGMAFSCRQSGSDGEPVILLHGFPETSHMWEPTLHRLAAAGYRCLAPDQRGYSPGARPGRVDQYRYEDLASDVVALADAWGAGTFHLVGHDWGALAGWAVLWLHPERVASWTALSVPHAKAFAQAVRDDPEEEPYRQVLQFLLSEGTAEQVFAANDYAQLKGVWRESAPEQAAEYLAVFSQPGALTGAMNWYRASRAHARTLDDPGVHFGLVSAPTLLIWGKNDPYIRRRAVELAAPYMHGEYRVLELDAGHWLVQEQPEAVASAVLEHVRAHPSGP